MHNHVLVDDIFQAVTKIVPPELTEKNLRVVAVSKESLEEWGHVLIMTPTQLEKHLIKDKKLRLRTNNLKIISFDEIDQILESFATIVTSCLQEISSNNTQAKILFASATLTDEEEELIIQNTQMEIKKVSVPFNNLEGIMQ